MDIWQTLGIEPTTDKRAIKRAYAKMLTKYHPEDQPEMFQQVQKAYESALLYADSQWIYAEPIFEESVSEEAYSHENNSIFTDDSDEVVQERVFQGHNDYYDKFDSSASPEKSKFRKSTERVLIAIVCISLSVTIIAAMIDAISSPPQHPPLQLVPEHYLFLGLDTEQDEEEYIPIVYMHRRTFMIAPLEYIQYAIYNEGFDLGQELISLIISGHYIEYGEKITTNSTIIFNNDNFETIVFLFFYPVDAPDTIIPFFIDISHYPRKYRDIDLEVNSLAHFNIHVLVAASTQELSNAVNIHRFDIGQSIITVIGWHIYDLTGFAVNKRGLSLPFFDYENPNGQFTQQFWSYDERSLRARVNFTIEHICEYR